MKQALTHGATIFAIMIVIGCGSLCAAADDFRERVAPIFQRRCLSCHNDGEPKGGFSLQTADAAFADGYIEAGDSDASYLVDVLTPVAGQAKMPKNADPLPMKEIATIRNWIDDGATWPADFILEPPSITNFDWWSYKPIVRPTVPKVDSPWVRTPIDAFILDKLNQTGLSYSDAADRRTLIRRVTYDLVGLPPTPEQVNAFVNDRSPEAYEQLVDRLLASKHYGERWARHWLDVVKYADTCGYDKDKLRPNAWPYRDYVIRSFNDDKPYARFVQEQIAGDALFPGESDGILGLGFIAAGPWDFIGHVEVPESKIDGKVARNLDRDDMVSNAINTFCSVTVQCARCHNHKFDPITQEHYYGLQAIFAALDRAERTYDLDPETEQRRRSLETKLQSLQTDLNAIQKEMADAGGTRLAELDKQIKELQTAAALKKDPQSGYHSAIANAPDSAKWVQVDLGEAVDVSKITLRPCHDVFAGIGAGFGFPVRFKVEISTDAETWVIVSDQTGQDYPNPNLAPFEIDGVDHQVRHIRVTATKLAERKNDWIFALAELQAFDRTGENRALGTAVTSLDSIEAPVRWSRKNLTDDRYPQASDPQAAEKLATAVRERTEILTRIETPERTERRQALQQSIRDTQEQLKALPQGKMVYAAATHFKPQSNFKPTEGVLRSVHTLHRGDVQQPRASGAWSVAAR